MSILENKTQILPNEILVKIFSHLNYNIVRRLSKTWKLFIEQNNLYFDLIKDNVKILKQDNISSLNLICSQIHEKIPLSSSNEILPNEKIILKSLITKLNIIKKKSSIKTINVKLDLFYLSNDCKKIKQSNNKISNGNLTTTNMGINTLGVFCIKHLLKCDVKNFKLIINNNYENLVDKCYAGQYEYNLVNFLVNYGYKYNLFIYKGSLKMFLIYDKRTNTFVYRSMEPFIRVHDKCTLSRYENYFINDYITARKLSKYKLQYLFIYHFNIDYRFQWSRRFDRPKIMKYNYFVDNIYKCLGIDKRDTNSNQDLLKVSKSNSCELNKIIYKVNYLKRSIIPFDLIFIKNHEIYTIDNFLNKSILQYN